MNDVRTCRRCHKLFNYISSPYCPACIEEIDREYRIVRDYIYENPNEGIKEISEATEVDERSILALLREGRLQLETASPALQCERCRANISSGRYCEDCQSKLSSELRRARQSFEPSSRHVDLDRSSKSRSKKRDDNDTNERMHSRNP